MNIKKLFYELYLFYLYTQGKIKKYNIGYEKSLFDKMLELIKWRFRERDFNKMYYAFGLNIKGNQMDNYIGKTEFLKVKNNTEYELKKRAGCHDLSYDVFTKDKYLFNIYLKFNNISCADYLGLIINGKYINNKNETLEISYLFGQYSDFVIKNIAMESSEGVYICTIQNDFILLNNTKYIYSEFYKLIENNIWIVQEKLISHSSIRCVNNSALNTARIVTIKTQHGIEYLTGFHSFARKGSKTDSWNSGSVYVGIDIDNESLKEYGYYNAEDKNNTITKKHPDTDVIFKGYNIPYLKESVNICKKVHSLMYFNFVIGWDIAITDKGPKIIEANEKPGMNAVQCLDGGLRRKIYYYSNQIIKNIY